MLKIKLKYVLILTGAAFLISGALPLVPRNNYSFG